MLSSGDHIMTSHTECSHVLKFTFPWQNQKNYHAVKESIAQKLVHMYCTSSFVNRYYVICMPSISISWLADKLMYPVYWNSDNYPYRIIFGAFEPLYTASHMEHCRSTISMCSTYRFFLLAMFGAAFRMYSSRFSMGKGLMCLTSLRQSSLHWEHLPRSIWNSAYRLFNKKYMI